VNFFQPLLPSEVRLLTVTVKLDCCGDTLVPDLFLHMAHKTIHSLLSLILWFNVINGSLFHKDSRISSPVVADAKTPQFIRPRRPIFDVLVVRGGDEHRSHPQSSLLTVKSTRGGEAAWESGVKNSIASALAAASSKLLLAPLDTIKTLQQHQRVTGQASLTLLGAAREIMSRPKGFLELYAGVGVAMVGSMPSVGLYFGIYSFCKKTFNRWDPNAPEGRKTLYIALSAAIGNTVASAARVPYEVVKQNFQTKVYESFGDAVR